MSNFGSREALLIEAFTQAIEVWGAETEGAVRAAVAAGAGPVNGTKRSGAR